MSSERLPEDRSALAMLAADALAVGVWLVDRAGNTCFRNETLDCLIPEIHTLRALAAAMPGVPIVAYVAQVSRGGRPVAEPVALLKSVEPGRLVQLRIKAGPAEVPGSAVITIEEISDRLRVERLRALAETTLALGHEVNNPLAILSGQIELLSAELDELRTEGSQVETDAPAAAPPPDLCSALAAMGERVVAMREAVTRIAGVLRRMRRVAEPLGADYLPSRGVRMLDLSAGATRTVLPPGAPDAAPGAEPKRASGDRAA
jgi:signal transduction histidine kinase